LAFTDETNVTSAFAYTYKMYFVIDLVTKWHSANKSGNLKKNPMFTYGNTCVKKTLKLILYIQATRKLTAFLTHAV
jgi:hypothetical protein